MSGIRAALRIGASRGRWRPSLREDVDRLRPGLGFWGLWVLASAGAAAFAVPLSTYVSWTTPGICPEAMADQVRCLLQGLVSGGILGLLGWLVLRRTLTRSGCWVAATCVTACLQCELWLATSPSPGQASGPVPTNLYLSVGGAGAALCSIPQWLCLRLLGRRALAWPVAQGLVGGASIVFWLSSRGLFDEVRSAAERHLGAGTLHGVIAASLAMTFPLAAIEGAFLGLVLVWILRGHERRGGADA